MESIWSTSNGTSNPFDVVDKLLDGLRVFCRWILHVCHVAEGVDMFDGTVFVLALKDAIGLGLLALMILVLVLTSIADRIEKLWGKFQAWRKS